LARLDDLKTFYRILALLHDRAGGYRTLANSNRRMNWPPRGVYFFFEHGEARTHSGGGLRVVRVGTHAVSIGSCTTLWQRLSQHRGPITTGAGNHRGSVFRELVGQAISVRSPGVYPVSWGDGYSAPRETRDLELGLEREVSRHIRGMPFLWLAVEDDPSRESQRSYVERNAIALLSNWRTPGNDALDPPSPGWLGRHCPSEQVKVSGLWNRHWVDGAYAPKFLEALDHLVNRM